MPTDLKERRPQTFGRRQTPLRGRNPFDGSTVWRAGWLGIFVTVSTGHTSNPEHSLAVGGNNYVTGLHSLDEIPDLPAFRERVRASPGYSCSSSDRTASLT